MSEHTMKLDDLYHRSLWLDRELADTATSHVSIKVVSRKVGVTRVTYLQIKSATTPQAFTDMEIPVSGMKIPPNVG